MELGFGNRKLELEFGIGLRNFELGVADWILGNWKLELGFGNWNWKWIWEMEIDILELDIGIGNDKLGMGNWIWELEIGIAKSVIGGEPNLLYGVAKMEAREPNL